MTWIKGKHTIKSGGSLTLRSREILNADTITGVFNFNNNMTSNCAGQPAGCTVNSATGFDVASFMLGLRQHQDPRRCSTPSTYTEKRPEYALYVQDDFRATNRLTLNLGLRWDVYPPWIEVDDRQSNFDETTGKFVVASDDAVIDGVEGRPLPADLLEARLRAAVRLRLRPRRQRQDRRPRRLRRLLELHARRHVVVEGAEPAVPAVDGAQRRPRRPTASTCCSRTACRRLRASIPTRPAAGSTRSIFDINFRDAYARHWNLNVQRSLGDELHGGSRLRRLAGPADAAQGRPEPGAAGRRRDRLERQPSVHHAVAGAAHDRPGPEQGHARLQRAAA